MAIALQTTAVPAGWLRSRSFDLGFILGIAALALGSGAIVVARPNLFGVVLFLDLWLLGYQHVVATYTRLCFDRDSFVSHRFLILWLPLIVLAVSAGLALGIGAWTLATLYFYWQWFHYTRQSWGISQAYRRKAGGLVTEGEWLSKVTFYILPLWGILHRSQQAPELSWACSSRRCRCPQGWWTSSAPRRWCCCSGGLPDAWRHGGAASSRSPTRCSS